MSLRGAPLTPALDAVGGVRLAAGVDIVEPPTPADWAAAAQGAVTTGAGGRNFAIIESLARFAHQPACL